MIGILDYGIGNVAALIRSFSSIGVPVEAVQRADSCDKFEGLVLPGVGSFDMVIQRLDALGFCEALDHAVRVQGKPILGICVGMQVMCRESEEGSLRGFGWVPAKVERLQSAQSDGDRKLVLPHMGWNCAAPLETERFLGGEGGEYYFLHSYAVQELEFEGNILATNYGGDFISGFELDNISAVQFHPEKSHSNGLSLLRGFSRKVENA